MTDSPSKSKITTLMLARAFLSVHSAIRSTDLGKEKLSWLVYFFLRDTFAKEKTVPCSTTIFYDEVRLYIPAIERHYSTLTPRIAREIASRYTRMQQTYYHYGAMAVWRLRERFYTMPSFHHLLQTRDQFPVVPPEKLTSDRLARDAKTVHVSPIQNQEHPIVYQRQLARYHAKRGRTFFIQYRKAPQY